MKKDEMLAFAKTISDPVKRESVIKNIEAMFDETPISKEFYEFAMKVAYENVFVYQLGQTVLRKEKEVVIVGRAEYLEQPAPRYMVQEKRDFEKQGLNFYNTLWAIEPELKPLQNEKDEETDKNKG